MFKQLLIASAILCAVLARTRLTPSSRLPTSFDDMLHNNDFPTGLGSTFSNAANYKIDGDSQNLVEQLSKSLPWIAIKSFQAMLQNIQSIKVGDIQSHYIFKAFPQEAVFRYALINLIRTDENSFSAVYTEKENKAFGIHSANTFHDMRTSVVGLTFENPMVLHQSGQNNPDFHDYNRNQLLAILKDARASRNTNNLGAFDIGKALNGAKSAVTGFIEVYKSVTEAFKTINKEEFKQKIPGEGFSAYSAKTRFLRNLGVPTMRWTDYVKAMKALFEIEQYPAVNRNLTAIMNIAEFAPDTAWHANDMTFAINKGGDCNTIVALCSQDYISSVINVLFTFVSGSFKLAPDIFVYTKFKSIAGGIYEETKDKVTYKPRSLKDEEIKAIHATMLLSGLNVMAENMGVTIKLPPLKTIIANAK